MTAASGGFCGVFQSAGVQSQADGESAQLSGATPIADRRPWLAQCAGAAAEQWHEEGDRSLAFHGEIYNAADLCRSLGLASETPLPRLLLAAWRRWSIDFLRQLNGSIALALHQGSELLLYRDPSGQQNLYYRAAAGGQLAFATHLDKLLKLPGSERRLAHRSLHEYLRFLDIAAPNTIFEGVYAVEAGQLLRCNASGIEPMVWPESGIERAPTAMARFADAVDLLDSHLLRSVQARLSDSTTPAAFLSGGVDSSLLCALASRQRGAVTAVTVGFEPAPYDETPAASRIAQHLGIKHEVLRFGRAQYQSAFDELSLRMEQPMADPATPATVLAFRHCQARFDTVLDGAGADEIVGSMPPRHVRLAVAYSSVLPPTLRKALVGLLQTVPPLSGYAPILDFEHPADTMIRWRGFNRLEIEALCGAPVSFAHTHFYRTFARFPRHAHFERFTALTNAMPGDRLNQAAIISGVRVRLPFWDNDASRFIRQLRTDFRHLPEDPKRILRALLARYVPRQIWDAPKHGFNFPLWEFLAGENFHLVRRHLNPELWRQSGLLSAKVVQTYAQQFIAGDRRLTFRIWSLVVLGAWLERHGFPH